MPQPDWPKAAPDDVASIEALLQAFDECLSFEPGNYRGPGDRMLSLFLPTASIVSPGAWSLAANPSGFAGFYDAVVRQEGFDQTGFSERNEIRKVVAIGNVNSVYTWYTIHAPPDAAPFGQGINLFHMVRQEGRFWISSLVWEDESDDAPTPPDLRPR